MPGVCAVLVSSSVLLTTRTPWYFHFESVIASRLSEQQQQQHENARYRGIDQREHQPQPPLAASDAAGASTASSRNALAQDSTMASPPTAYNHTNAPKLDVPRIARDRRKVPHDPQRQARVQHTRQQKPEEALRGSPHQADAARRCRAERNTCATCTAARPAPS